MNSRFGRAGLRLAFVLALGLTTARPLSAQTTAPAAAAAAPTTAPASFAQTLRDVTSKGVCRVIVSDTFGNEVGSGSGFVVTEDGFVVTNHHVIEGAGSAVVEFPAMSIRTSVELWQTWPQYDLALLKVDVASPNWPAGQKLRPLPLAASRPLLAADVYTLGYPLSTKLGLTVNRGIVSGLRGGGELASLVNGPRDQQTILRFDEQICFVQIDSAINAGNSGGPLIDGSGEVLGVNTLSLATANSFYFAVAAEHVRDVLAGRPAAALTFAKAPPPPVDPTVASRRGYPPGTRPPGYPPGYPGRSTPGYPPGYPQPPVAEPPPAAFTGTLPPASDPFWTAPAAPPARQSIAVAATIARDLAGLRLQSCSACGGTGQVRQTKQDGIARDAFGQTVPNMVTTKTPCRRCNESGKVPPKDGQVYETAQRLATSLAATGAGTPSPTTRPSAPEADLARRLDSVKWGDVFRWGLINAKLGGAMNQPLKEGTPVVHLGRVVHVAAEGETARRYVIAAPKGSTYFVPANALLLHEPSLGDRVLLIGVTGATKEVDATKLVALHSVVIRPFK